MKYSNVRMWKSYVGKYDYEVNKKEDERGEAYDFI